MTNIYVGAVDLVEPVGHFLDKAREILAGRNEGGKYFQGVCLNPKIEGGKYFDKVENICRVCAYTLRP